MSTVFTVMNVQAHKDPFQAPLNILVVRLTCPFRDIADKPRRQIRFKMRFSAGHVLGIVFYFQLKRWFKA